MRICFSLLMLGAITFSGTQAHSSVVTCSQNTIHSCENEAGCISHSHESKDSKGTSEKNQTHHEHLHLHNCSACFYYAPSSINLEFTPTSVAAVFSRLNMTPSSPHLLSLFRPPRA